MIVTIILGLFSVLFAYLAKYKNTQWGLKISFTLIFLFLALRYNFGNDYETYLNAFIDITYHGEPGWVFLNWIFRSLGPLGFFAMTAGLALFNCAIYYRFIKKYVPVGYYWLAIFLYIFYPDFMLINSSAMRQSIAIALFVFSLDYLCKKDAIRYFLCIGLASTFHLSALILLPVFLLALFNRNNYKFNGAIFISIYISLFIFGESLSLYIKKFVSIFFEKYEVYTTDTGVYSTGLGFVFLFAMLMLTLYFARLQNKEIGLVFKIAIISFMLMPLNLAILLIGRIGMYFSPATLVVYPIILRNLKKPISRTIFITIILIFTTYKFFQFFYSDIWKDAFGTYQTIFSAPK
jgi:hypothetical protein